MNNIKKSIFKIQTESAVPGVQTDVYSYGTYQCITGTVGIGSPTPGGDVYYLGSLADNTVTGVFQDAALTIPIPHDYIRTNSPPRYFISVDPSNGNVTLVQPEGDPC